MASFLLYPSIHAIKNFMIIAELRIFLPKVIGRITFLITLEKLIDNN